MKFSFGFELEGIISSEVGVKVIKTLSIPPSDLGRYFHQDGSVRTRPKKGFEAFGGHEPRCNCGRCTRYFTEYSSPVFTTANAFLKHLSLFEEGKHHLWDTSCGLHFNFGVQGIGKNKLFALTKNYELLKEIRKEAMNMCVHQRNRLKNPTQYYYWYKSKRHLLAEAEHEKYRFVRYHPGGYLEFRFMSPCEHKVKNVMKVIQILTSYLQKNSRERFIISVPERSSGEVIRITKSFKIPRKEVLEIGQEGKGGAENNFAPYILTLHPFHWMPRTSLYSTITGRELTLPQYAQIEQLMRESLLYQLSIMYLHSRKNYETLELQCRRDVFSRYQITDSPDRGPTSLVRAAVHGVPQIDLGQDEKPKLQGQGIANGADRYF